MTRFFALVVSFVALASVGNAFSTENFLRAKGKTNPSALKDVPDGWTGGFMESNPEFSYPRASPDLSSIPILSNYDNIDKITRMQRVKYPEFSWLSKLGDESSRVYMKWNEDISRMGYTDDGRIYSIICPQQGQGSSLIGELNVEATVTGTRGWVDEPNHTFHAEMTVMAQIWYTPDPNSIVHNTLVNIVKKHLPEMPFSKEHSIKISTHNLNEPFHPIFAVRNGTSAEFRQPKRIQHYDDCYGVGNLLIQIGEIHTTGNAVVDAFNQMIVDIFNIVYGNMLAEGSEVSWNVWTLPPEPVDEEEWRTHSEKWRESLVVSHIFPDGTSKFGDILDYDGVPFNAKTNLIKHEMSVLKKFISVHKREMEDHTKDAFVGFLEGIHDRFLHKL